MTDAARRPRTHGHEGTANRLCGGLLLVVIAVLSAPATAIAGEETLNLTGFYLQDPDLQLKPDQALSQFRQGSASPMAGGRFNQGNLDSQFWLYLRVVNLYTAPATRLLSTGVPFRAGLDAHLIRKREGFSDGVLILEESEFLPFSARDSDAHTLHSASFVIDAGETIELLMRYRTRGTTYMPLQLVTPDAFAETEHQDTLSAALFYTVCLVLLALMFMFGIALKTPAVLSYSTLFTVGLLFIAATEGYAYQYLWPDSPQWNQYAGLVMMLCCAGLSFAVARTATVPESLTNRRARVLEILAAFSFLLAMFSSRLPFTALIHLGSLLVLSGYIAQLATIASWLKAAHKRHLVTLTSALILAPILVLLIVLVLIGFDLPDFVFEHLTRSVYLFTMVSIFATLIINVMALKLDHEKSLQASLEAAERDADMSRALLEAEQNYGRARDLAQHHKEQLVATSHDIRQPLVSLRAVLDSGTLNLGREELETLRRSLDHIEALSRPGRDVHTDAVKPPRRGGSGVEPYRADLLLETTQRMFEGEASGKLLDLKHAKCSVMLSVPPLQIMRILTNLAANAVKHCEHGRILLGCRRRGEQLRFDVIDTGQGLASEDLQRLQKPYEKGEHSSGEGLGLAICWQLAAENGFSLEVASRPGSGTRFSLTVSTSPVGQPVDSAMPLGQ
ncbi:MAG: sensor histidine kinase [Pseudomonadota bacterium]